MTQQEPNDVCYSTVQEYQEHYKRVYCRQKIYTADGIRVYFDPWRFDHAFYEGKKKGIIFSWERARKIDWIKFTLEHKDADLRFGYYPEKKQTELNRRVAVIFENYQVVLELYLKNDVLTAKFKTAFPIRGKGGYVNSPKWDKQTCLDYLKKKGH